MKIDCLVKCTIEIDETAPDWIKDGESYMGGLEGLVGDVIEDQLGSDDNYYNPGSRTIGFDSLVKYVTAAIRAANTRLDNV